MFESEARLSDEVRGLLDAVREATGARYACIAEKGRIRFESAATEAHARELRAFLEPRLTAIFELPASLAGTGPEQDAFESRDEDEFVLAFLNGRGALLLACHDADAARERAERLFTALADRLLRLEPSWRVDAQGRGLFFGRPRVDWVVVGRRAGDEFRLE